MRYKIISWFFLLIVFINSFVRAAELKDPELKDMDPVLKAQLTVIDHHHPTTGHDIAPFQGINPNIQFVPFSKIRANLPFVSQTLIDKMVNSLLKRKRPNMVGFLTNPLVLGYDHGNSPFNESFNVLQVKDAEGKEDLYVLCEKLNVIRSVIEAVKHAGGQLDYITVPVIIINNEDEITKITNPEFWAEAARNKVAHLEGYPTKPWDNAVRASEYFANLTIDQVPYLSPNVSFLQSTAVTLPLMRGQALQYRSQDRSLAVWLNSMDFMQFGEHYLGEILRKGGFLYNEGDRPTPELAEQARKIFISIPNLESTYKIRIIRNAETTLQAIEVQGYYDSHFDLMEGKGG